MSVYNSVAHHVLAPSLDLLRGTHTMRELAALERTQWWSLERIEALQAERLRSLIQHAYTNVPYYRRVMLERGLTPADITSPTDISKLPILTKDIIRDNLEEMCSEGPLRNRLVPAHTSGSTGNPLLFYDSIDERRAHGLARAIRAREWAGVRLGDRSMHIHLRSESLPRRQRPAAWVTRELRRVVDVDSGSTSEHTLPGIIARMRQIEPFYLDSYPSIIFFIASFIRDSGLSAPHPLAIITGGEQLLDHQRELIADVFGTEPYSKYSSFENWEMASECPSHSGMHVNAEDIILELVDEAGAPTPRGERGAILITNLHNYGMPFIRYENGDYSSLAEAPCPCGRGLPLLDSLLGRLADFVYSKSGRRVTATGMPLGRLALLGITRFQIVQDEPGRIVLRVIAPEATTASAKEAVKNGVREHLLPSLGPGMHMEVEFTQHIEPTAAGKHLPVLSRLTPTSLPPETTHTDGPNPVTKQPFEC